MRAALGFEIWSWASIASLAAARRAAPNADSVDGRSELRDGAGFGGGVGRFAASGIIGAVVELIGSPFSDSGPRRIDSCRGVVTDLTRRCALTCARHPDNGR